MSVLNILHITLLIFSNKFSVHHALDSDWSIEAFSGYIFMRTRVVYSKWNKKGIRKKL